jgi:eukaryotic-like serine/threonine-protein kinase
METMRLCSDCGANLAADAPHGLCPDCLLKAGFGSQTETAAPAAASGRTAPPRALPSAGDQFGSYRIVRELGHGGMGAVYEAEHLESGRRVALKVLSHKLDSPDARKRFLREGRLAASINHPNSVYVYGTEEIDGTPAIAMELIAGGTLQERVQKAGPLPAATAVDAILQVIAGLEAAQALGILHHDIKPSNCFEDADGAVKVGDFGLSISTATRAETSLTLQGAFLGTPVFSSPEQLRGEELNARSDMYSVGVTLYYLLTGRTPFEGHNMVQLLANVLEQPAPSPRKFHPAVPAGLAKAVLRCLEKQAGERFKSYDELRQALAPFSSAAPIPAPLGLRFAAGGIDVFSVGLVGAAMSLVFFGSILPLPADLGVEGPRIGKLVAVAFVMVLSYYAVLEGLWGASLGKALCRLRVAGPDRNPPGIPRALARALIFQILPVLPYWVSFGFNPLSYMSQTSLSTQYLVSTCYYLIVGLLFCTARRRNGFAAVQDLLTGTRVIRRPSHQARPVLPAGEETPLATTAAPAVGPYHVLQSLEKSASGEWLLAYDTRLLRKVWIHVVLAGTPPVLPPLRNLGRVGRLRWITGRRSPEENWDAFEGVTGKPFLSLLGQPQPWSQVRFWLLDVAQELGAAEKDGTLPQVLALDRVWITADGRAKLFDFPAPGVSPGAGGDGANGRSAGPPVCLPGLEAKRFLAQIACSALEGRVVPAAAEGCGAVSRPLPLHARAFLEKLPALPDITTIVATLAPLLQHVTAVSRLRRAGVVGGCLVFPFVAAIGMVAGLCMLDNFQRSQPELAEMSQLLQQRQGLRLAARFSGGRAPAGPEDRLFAIYVAAHYRPAITNSGSWSSVYALTMINGEGRRFAEESIRQYLAPTEGELREATKAITPLLEAAKSQMSGFVGKPWFVPMMGGMCLVLYVGLPALFAALLFRGGLVLRVFGLAVVRKDGSRASRLRVFWRGLVAWAPVLLAPVLLAPLTPLLGVPWSAALVVTLAGSLVAWSIARPERSLQDRIAGTALVPR